MLKVTAFTASVLIALSTAAHADVRNVCNGGTCRTIVTNSGGSIIWISDLWYQH